MHKLAAGAIVGTIAAATALVLYAPQRISAPEAPSLEMRLAAPVVAVRPGHVRTARVSVTRKAIPPARSSWLPSTARRLEFIAEPGPLAAQPWSGAVLLADMPAARVAASNAPRWDLGIPRAGRALGSSFADAGRRIGSAFGRAF